MQRCTSRYISSLYDPYRSKDPVNATIAAFPPKTLLTFKGTKVSWLPSPVETW